MAKFPMVRDPERRRAPRFPWELDAVLVIGDSGRPCRTVDVSLYGAFLRTDDPIELDHIIPVWIQPPNDEPIEWVGVARRVVPPDRATATSPAGMGLEIFTIDEPNWDRWRSLIAWVGDRCEAIHGPRHQRSAGPKEKARRYVRYRVPVEVRLKTMPELIRFGARDISAGGVFLRPAPPLEFGDEVSLSLQHPLSGARFELEGRVVRVQPEGAALEFINLTQEVRDRLRKFIVTGVRPT